ncbi:pentatricopeptide repeat-containing protein At2g42920, chloroplastic-like [Glycine soja]|uniref:pentatricopeptide repeat-containing protein At2g42920, chloroplastic-like n=1 Tax=Glycine soja TaxID=3848 RepID=UPI0003DEAF0E|nr:pentatricopeptide repeat-containing protein At2g42920, chloroplastic-like [Glycine soja]
MSRTALLTISLKPMINGYVKNKRLIEALELFHKMQRQRVQPSEFTMVSLLSACTHLGALQHGEWVHDYVKRGHFELNVIVLTTIIGMYCKCGAIVKGIQGQSNTHNICGMVYFAMMLEA